MTAPARTAPASAPPAGGSPRRPRVLFVMLRVEDQIYGGTRCLLTFLERSRRVEPFVAVFASSPDDPALAELREKRIPHETIMLPSDLGGGRGPLRRLRRAARLAWCNRQVLRLVRREEPDVVHLDAEAFLLAGPAAKLAGRKLVHHLRGVQPNLHVGLVRSAALATADRNVAVSASLADFYCDECHALVRGRVAERTTHVYDPIPLDEIARLLDVVVAGEARRELEIPARRIAVGLVGGIFPPKGQREFMREIAPEVVRRIPEVHFYLVGGIKDAAYAEAVREAVREQALEDHVTFTGYRSDVYRWYCALDVLALPSFREGFCGVVVEAQAFGVPVVASDIVGVRDALADGVGGYRAPDSRTFAELLVRLARDPELRAEHGRRGRRYVERFAIDRVTRDLEAVHHDLAGVRLVGDAGGGASS